MTVQKGFLIAGLAALLIVGCSEEKKREAARLEAQLNGDTAATTDVAAVPVTSPQDSLQSQASPAESTTVPAATPLVSVTTDSAIVGRDTTVRAEIEKKADQPQDSVPPDVNAVPEETGRSRSEAMPPQLRDLFTVQVASSPSETYSKTVVDSFVSRGYEAYIATVTVGEKTYYRVRVGKFSARSEASAVSAEINDKYLLQSWVDKIAE
jgi:cell division septation protein DedD